MSDGDQDAAKKRSWRIAAKSPFLSFERAGDSDGSVQHTRSTFGVFGLGEWTVEHSDILGAAGTRSDQGRRARSTLAVLGTALSVVGALAGLVAAIVISGSGKGSLGGSQAAVIATVLGVSVSSAAAIVAGRIDARRRDHASIDEIRPPNLERLAVQLESDRRATLERWAATRERRGDAID